MRMIRFQVSSRSAAFPLLPRHFRALALAVLDALGPGALDEGEDRGDLAFAEDVFEAGHGADASAAKELGAALGDHLDQQTVRVMPGVAGLVMGRSGEGAIRFALALVEAGLTRKVNAMSVRAVLGIHGSAEFERVWA